MNDKPHYDPRWGLLIGLIFSMLAVSPIYVLIYFHGGH